MVNRKLLLSFEHVAYMGSTMIREIISLSKLCTANEVDLKLCCISSEILEVFRITKLTKRLKVYDTEAQALAAFAGSRKHWFQRASNATLL